MAQYLKMFRCSVFRRIGESQEPRAKIPHDKEVADVLFVSIAHGGTRGTLTNPPKKQHVVGGAKAQNTSMFIIPNALPKVEGYNEDSKLR
jgi:hypothetical protein